MKLSEKLIASFAALLLSWHGAANAQDAKLIEAAKKEGGKVVAYGSLENETMELLAAAFKKKTGLDVDYWRAASNKITDRVANELRAGKPLADVVLTTEPVMQVIQKDGFLAKYNSPAAHFFSKRSDRSQSRANLPFHGDRDYLPYRNHQTRGRAQVS